jgi:hypothetical protein
MAVILHHTESSPRRTIAALREQHIAKGWRDIAYHWLVRKGQVLPGRPEHLVGAHAPTWNAISIAVALVGDYRTKMPPEDQLEACLGVLVDIRSRHGPFRILSHKEAMALSGAPSWTDCPGVDWVDVIRERLPGDGPP